MYGGGEEDVPPLGTEIFPSKEEHVRNKFTRKLVRVIKLPFPNVRNILRFHQRVLAPNQRGGDIGAIRAAIEEESLSDPLFSSSLDKDVC